MSRPSNYMHISVKQFSNNKAGTLSAKGKAVLLEVAGYEQDGIKIGALTYWLNVGDTIKVAVGTAAKQKALK